MAEHIEIDENRMFAVETTEEKCITGSHSVRVTFRLPYHCWCKLSKKTFWKKVQRFLSEENNKKWNGTP